MERLKIIANSSSLPQLGEGAVLNHYKNLKFTLLHVFAVGTVSLFPPYKSTNFPLWAVPHPDPGFSLRVSPHPPCGHPLPSERGIIKINK